MNCGKSIIVFFCLLLLQTRTALAGGVLPAAYKITDDGLKVTQSFDPQLEVGDVITHADEQKIKPRLAEGLMTRLAKKKDALNLTISRGEKTLKHRVKLVSADKLDHMLRTQQWENNQKRKEEEVKQWFANNKLTDSQGKTWALAEIKEHNDPIEVDITRVIRKHRDANQDRGGRENESLGTKIEKGFNVLKFLESILQAPEESPIKLNVVDPRDQNEAMFGSGNFAAPKTRAVKCRTLSDVAPYLSDSDCKYAETLFDFTDAENYLIWCRNGAVISAEQMWRELAARNAGK